MHGNSVLLNGTLIIKTQFEQGTLVVKSPRLREKRENVPMQEQFITNTRSQAQLASARPSVREVLSSIPGDATSLFQLLSFSV